MADPGHHGHSSQAFTIDCLEGTVAILDDRIGRALQFLLTPDISYGLTAIGVQAVVDILRGDDDG